MRQALMSSMLLTLAVVASLARADMPKGEYLDGKSSKSAVILAHGQGLDADAVVVGPLRRAIHQRLGMHTLSLSMPTLPGARSLDTFEEYTSTFPDAHARIQSAIDFLTRVKGVERIYLMGHSMGGRMTSAYLAGNPDPRVVGFIGVGLLGGGKEPLNTNLTLRKVKLPVLDVYAENDRDAKSAEARKALVSDRFVQVPIAGAMHDYKGHEKQVADAVIAWIEKQEPK